MTYKIHDLEANDLYASYGGIGNWAPERPPHHNQSLVDPSPPPATRRPRWQAPVVLAPALLMLCCGAVPVILCSVMCAREIAEMLP